MDVLRSMFMKSIIISLLTIKRTHNEITEHNLSFVSKHHSFQTTKKLNHN